MTMTTSLRTAVYRYRGTPRYLNDGTLSSVLLEQNISNREPGGREKNERRILMARLDRLIVHEVNAQNQTCLLPASNNRLPVNRSHTFSSFISLRQAQKPI